jgi:superfamily II DNA or RNA helicase
LVFSNYLRSRKYKRVFIFSPLRVHAKQTMERVKLFLLEDEYKYLLVDSDTRATTDIDEIKNVLNENEKTVLSVTFNSAENIISQFFYNKEDEEDYKSSDNEDLSEKNEDVNECVDEEDKIKSEEEEYDDDTQLTIKKCCHIDLDDSILIIDECHNLINNDNLINIIKQFPNVLLVTATPPSKMDEIMSSELIYDYKFCNAIKDKAICDYRIYLPYIVETDEIPEELKDVNEIDDNLYKKGLFLINGLLQKGSRYCINFFLV